MGSKAHLAALAAVDLLARRARAAHGLVRAQELRQRLARALRQAQQLAKDVSVLNRLPRARAVVRQAGVCLRVGVCQCTARCKVGEYLPRRRAA
jgi:hypothetical protein